MTRRRQSPDREVFSDAGFHAYRADAYARAGRDADALANAQTAFALLTHAPQVMTGAWAQLVLQPVDTELAYGLILPILKKGRTDRHFADALAAFTALPIQDYHSYSNRSAVINSLGDHTGALQENERALALAPSDPQVLNNQCFELAELGRGNDALPVLRASGANGARRGAGTQLVRGGACRGGALQRGQSRTRDGPRTGSGAARLSAAADLHAGALSFSRWTAASAPAPDAGRFPSCRR